ncbi:MAG: hypothetical protein KAG82_12795 [Alcanivoracaceae bacterium]|nr:hypothetical protein [Alcanivoracaceae bacterium]
MDDNFHERISELEIMVEEMERTHAILYGILVGGIIKMTFGSWLWPVLFGVGASFAYWRFFAKKPFSGRDAGADSSTE